MLIITKNNDKLWLKISSDYMEINLTLREEEAKKLVENIKYADWNERKSIKAGICLKSSVFWCINENKSINILIGQDDETWEIATILPFEIINELAKSIN